MGRNDSTNSLTAVVCGECGQGKYLYVAGVLVCTSCRHTIDYSDLRPEPGTELVFVGGIAYAQDADGTFRMVKSITGEVRYEATAPDGRYVVVSEDFDRAGGWLVGTYATVEAFEDGADPLTLTEHDSESDAMSAAHVVAGILTRAARAALASLLDFHADDDPADWTGTGVTTQGMADLRAFLAR